MVSSFDHIQTGPIAQLHFSGDCFGGVQPLSWQFSTLVPFGSSAEAERPHYVVGGLNVCSPDGGNLQRNPHYDLNHNIQTDIISI